jgi:hypothetical protein
MKKSAVSIRTMKFEDVRFLFDQLRKDLFFDRYIITVYNDQNSRQSFSQQMVYINQHTGKEYSFPGITFSRN